MGQPTVGEWWRPGFPAGAGRGEVGCTAISGRLEASGLGVKNLARRAAGSHAEDMHLAYLRLRDFRNYARLDVDFTPGFHLLLGDNAQGKTNILEAIYLIATLRSLRGVGSAQMVRHGQRSEEHTSELQSR